MDRLRRYAGPIVHSVRTFPSMLYEFACIPGHMVRQYKDWNTLCGLYPGLAAFIQHRRSLTALLRDTHRDYIRNFSAPLITLSLNRAAFLLFLSRTLAPARVLDLGSGFSSYVFRLYQKDNPGVQILSVDDSAEWLEQTRRFLKKYDLPVESLMLHDEMSKTASGLHCDLCFLDMGDLPMRRALLPALGAYARENGAVVIVDDFHVPTYRRFIRRFCAAQGLQLFSLRRVTRRRLSHAALICR